MTKAKVTATGVFAMAISGDDMRELEIYEVDGEGGFRAPADGIYRVNGRDVVLNKGDNYGGDEGGENNGE